MQKYQNITPRELLSKAVLVLYLTLLLWLVLFKFSFDIPFIITEHQTASLNLIPFIGHPREMIDNVVVFIPFGLLLSVGFKRIALWKKLAFISGFSIVIEIVQYILAIGITDITDVITNTVGGLIGLLGYDFCKKYVNSRKIDLFIIIACMLVIILFLALRMFVLKVKY